MKLIDADALLRNYTGNILTAQTDYAQGARDIMDDIRNAPTVDAVSVTRCKDCKYRIQQQTVPLVTTDPQCIWFRIYRNPNGYCHLGEKNENGYE